MSKSGVFATSPGSELGEKRSYLQKGAKSAVRWKQTSEKASEQRVQIEAVLYCCEHKLLMVCMTKEKLVSLERKSKTRMTEKQAGAAKPQ